MIKEIFYIIMKGFFMRPKILYEDNSIIVCHKPAGYASQSDRSFHEDMVSFLKKHLAKELRRNSSSQQEPYLGIIHRLDKPVSGILVYAKNKKAAASLSLQVQGSSSEKMQKKYHATVHGKLETPDFFTLTNELLFDKKKNISYILENKTPQSKTAILKYRTLRTYQNESGEDLTDLDILLLTGRHHQIRAQLSHLGYPIVGDNKYGTLDDSKIPLCLCAYSLTFVHPDTKKLISFSLDGM